MRPTERTRNPPLLSHLLPALVGAVLTMAMLPTAVAAAEKNYQTLDWTDLLPPNDLEALRNGPEVVHDTPENPDGASPPGSTSLEDQIANQVRDALQQNANSAYQQALVSTRTITTFDNKKVRIPGFIVPLEFSEDQVITEFFLVPYFGACIHVPPPPPNQIIYVTAARGVKVEALYTPFWVTGILHNKMVQNDTAQAAYSITAQEVVLYDEAPQ